MESVAGYPASFAATQQYLQFQVCFLLALLQCSYCHIAAGADSTWIISAEDRAKHNAQFEQLKPVNGFVTGIDSLYAL